MPDLTPWLFPLITGVLIAGIGGWVAIRNRRGTEVDKSRSMVPPTWADVYARLDLQDKKIRLMVGIVSAAADQWPTDAPGPQFDQETRDLIAELDDTLVPAKWRRGLRPKPAV